MKFTFTEKKVQVSDDLRSYAEKKIGRLDRLFKTEADAFVSFSIQRGRHIAEVTIKSGGMFYRANESTSDMYASIDSAVASIERQIRKNKTRLEKKLRDGAFEREIKPAVIVEDPDEEEKDFKVIRSKRFPIKPMSVEEAILQMNLLGHEFFAFKNQEENGAFSIVYKRKDSGYGLIINED